MNLLYEDEDKILPRLLHRVDEGLPPFRCRDCDGIRARMIELELDDNQFPLLVA